MASLESAALKMVLSPTALALHNQSLELVFSVHSQYAESQC